MNTVFERTSLKFAIAVSALLLMQGCATTTSIGYRASGDDPFDITAQADRAYERGDWIVAEKYYQELTRAVPKDAYGWTRLGNIRLRRHDFTGAIVAYEESLERDRESSRTHYNLATAHLLKARQSLHNAQQHLAASDEGNKLIDEKLSYFDILVYEPVIEVTSPMNGLIEQN